MTMAGAPWPTRDEYDIAVARWTETIWDADIRSGTLAYDNMGICRFGGANLYVSIYKIGDWMVRCFCSKPGKKQTPLDIQERYQAIDRFGRTHAQRISALVPITYLEQGITVGMRVLPIVKMPFLTGCPSLGEFIMDSYYDHTTMQRLCAAWLRMIGELETASMAHGDLDLTNVLVQQTASELTLKLIDYDNTWIPELAGHGQTECGHIHFQHPQFLPPHPRPYSVEMDRFSALVMYISLKTLVTQPKLYEDWGADESERLLLVDTDYQNAGLAGSRLEQLRSLSSPDMYPYIDELSASLREARMPCSLTTLTQGAVLPHFTAQPMQTVRTMQPQRPAGPVAPARADWKNAVYNANAFFATPPAAQQPSAPAINGASNNGTSLAATAPWRPMGAYQHAEGDAGRLSTPPWAVPSAVPTPLQAPALYPVAGSSPQASLTQQAPRPPLQMPPQPSWSQNMGSSQAVPMPQSPWNTSMGNSQFVPSPAQSWRTPMALDSTAPPQTPQPSSTTLWSYSDTGYSQLQAPPFVGNPTPLTPMPPSNDDDRPMLFSAQGGKNAPSIRTVLAIVVICLLVLLILAASVTLVLILTRQHIGSGVLSVPIEANTTGGISIHWGGTYVALIATKA